MAESRHRLEFIHNCNIDETGFWISVGGQRYLPQLVRTLVVYLRYIYMDWALRFSLTSKLSKLCQSHFLSSSSGCFGSPETSIRRWDKPLAFFALNTYWILSTVIEGGITQVQQKDPLRTKIKYYFKPPAEKIYFYTGNDLRQKKNTIFSIIWGFRKTGWLFGVFLYTTRGQLA